MTAMRYSRGLRYLLLPRILLGTTKTRLPPDDGDEEPVVTVPTPRQPYGMATASRRITSSKQLIPRLIPSARAPPPSSSDTTSSRYYRCRRNIIEAYSITQPRLRAGIESAASIWIVVTLIRCAEIVFIEKIAQLLKKLRRDAG